MTTSAVWKKCSACKKDILMGGRYYVCSVSTCQGQRTGYVFCSVQCFEVHLPGAKHRDAAAIEHKAPRIITSAPATATSGTSSTSKAAMDDDILIVASKLKKYIKSFADMNTSDNVMEILSDYVRQRARMAVEKARAEGRKTVLDRDFR